MKPWMMAVVSGGANLVTKTYTSSQTITIPLGVSRLETLVGKGKDGTPETYEATTIELVRIQRTSSVSGGIVSRAFMQDLANDAFGDLNGSGTRTATFNQYLFVVDTIDRAAYDPFSKSYQVRGSATKSYGLSSGNLTYANAPSTYFDAVIDVRQSGTTGASTTGFGKTFPGGVEAPAESVTYTNVAVTGGASYSLVIPSGGSITITYYQ